MNYQCQAAKSEPSCSGALHVRVRQDLATFAMQKWYNEPGSADSNED